MGKRGTAQKFKDGALAVGKYVSSFIGIYPTKSPKYVVFISVDEPSNGVYYGGMVAKPIGQQVFSEMFSVKNISPDDQSQLDNQPNISMPDLIGKTVADASGTLKYLGLNANIEGLGGYVINQLPSAGTKIFTGEEVLIFTND